MTVRDKLTPDVYQIWSLADPIFKDQTRLVQTISRPWSEEGKGPLINVQLTPDNPGTMITVNCKYQPAAMH